MKTVVLLQALFASLALTYADTWAYHVPVVCTQLLLWFYDSFPFNYLRLVSSVSLGVSVLTSSLLLLISFVRMWRYFFFPVKEQFAFAAECFANIPIVLAQLAFLFIQSKSLLEKKDVKYSKDLYRTTVYIMFFHDFVYAWILAPFGGEFVVFAFTQFVVHTLMIVLEDEARLPDYQVLGFRVAWSYLIAQHLYVIVRKYDYTVVRGFTGVYIVVSLMYLTNSFLLPRKSKDSKST